MTNLQVSRLFSVGRMGRSYKCFQFSLVYRIHYGVALMYDVVVLPAVHGRQTEGVGLAGMKCFLFPHSE